MTRERFIRNTVNRCTATAKLAIPQVLFASLLVLVLASCDTAEPGPDYITPTIIAPVEGEVITDSTYTMHVKTESNCGCKQNSIIYIDSTAVHMSIVWDFKYNIQASDYDGEHVIRVHSEVPGKSEGWDSVRVTFDLQ